MAKKKLFNFGPSDKAEKEIVSKKDSKKKSLFGKK